MDVVHPELFLNDQLPQSCRSRIAPALNTAYQAARDLIASEPILQVESARDNHGRIISWTVDLAFQRLIESGRWPFDFRWRPFAQPTGRYLEVRLSHSVMSISQVSAAAQQPRDVRFRHNARLRNQRVFAFDEFKDELQVQGLPHLLLIHGHQQLHFAHVGLPDPDHGRGYIYQTGNLMRLPFEVPSPVPATEVTDVEPEISLKDLKEQIERWRRDNDD